MTDKEKLKKAIALIKQIRTDAKMALDKRWDKSDDGFEDQIICIDRFLESLKNEPKPKLEQIKMDI